MPNGFRTFRTLHLGETLNVPDKWFTKEFDALPPSYFAALPHPDGVTIGTGRLPCSAYLPPVPAGEGLLNASFSAALISAAQAASNAIAADANYCVSVAQAGSSVNSAVHAFKAAWNASQSPPVPINTGRYESSVAAALAQVIGSAPAGCDAPHGAAIVTAAPAKAEMSTGAVIGVALLAAGAVGGAVYLYTHHQPTRQRVQRVVRRVYP